MIHEVSGFETAKYLPKLLTSRAELFLELAEKYGDVVKVKAPGITFYIVSKGEYAARVFHYNYKNYRKSFDWKIVKDILGDGPITTHDQEWTHSRKTTRPFFKEEVIQSYQAKMKAVIERNLTQDRLGEFCGFDLFSKLALDIFASCFLSLDLSDEQIDELIEIVADILNGIEQRVSSYRGIGQYIPTPTQYKYKKAKKRLHELLIKWNNEADESQTNFFSRLNAGAPHEGKERNMKWVVDHIVSYFTAGHETTAVAMCWALYCLCTNPEEVTKIRKDESYLKHFVQEVLRLYPPIWCIGRETVEEEVLGEFKIPPKSTVFVSPYVVHRYDKFWEDPEAFRPERFMSEKEMPMGCYVPFGLGPRRCPGERFALQEIEMALKYLVDRYNFELLNPPNPLKLNAFISLRAKEEFNFRASPLH